MVAPTADSPLCRPENPSCDALHSRAHSLRKPGANALAPRQNASASSRLVERENGLRRFREFVRRTQLHRARAHRRVLTPANTVEYPVPPLLQRRCRNDLGNPHLRVVTALGCGNDVRNRQAARLPFRFDFSGHRNTSSGARQELLGEGGVRGTRTSRRRSVTPRPVLCQESRAEVGGSIGRKANPRWPSPVTSRRASRLADSRRGSRSRRRRC